MCGPCVAGSAAIEHDAVRSWVSETLLVRQNGAVAVVDPAISTVQWANSETGIMQDVPRGLAVCDLTQAFGKVAIEFDGLRRAIWR